jgi:glycosyltransferase involved in cell wall biosynthesis
VQSGGTRFNPHSFDHIAYLARYFIKNGHKVTVVDYKHPGDAKVETVNGMTIVRLSVVGFNQTQIYRLLRVRPFHFSPGWVLERILYALSVIIYLSKRKFDVIYCNSTFLSLLLIYLFPKLRQKLVYHSLIYPIEKNQRSLTTWLAMFFENIVARHVSRVVVEVEQARQRIINEAGVDADKVLTVEPGVDVSFWTPNRDRRKKLREQYRLNGKTVILFHARVVPRKGVEHLIKAADILINEKHYRNLVFVIAGPPTEGAMPLETEKTYIKRLSNLLWSLKLSESVKLILGWHPAEFVRDLYEVADIYVLPTLSDLTPHTVKQAMAMAKPVVTTTASWIPYVIKNGDEALLVMPGQERVLAEAIEKLITNPVLQMNMSHLAWRKARERWNIEKQAEKWMAVFQQVYETDKE